LNAPGGRYGGFHSHGGSPLDGGKKWRITREEKMGYHDLGKPKKLSDEPVDPLLFGWWKMVKIW